MAGPGGDHAAMVASGRWKEAIQAYLAAGSYADAEIGRLIEALDASGRAENTIVVLWGDHGWHLGEKEHWRKFALWEEACRAPLIWVAPGVTQAGGRCHRPVDFLTVFPTLCELAGIPAPGHLEGRSVRSLLVDPSAAWDAPAVTTHGFKNHAVRTEQWRYIRYADGSEELYDHEADPMEWTNLAMKPETASIRAKLAGLLPKQDQAAVAARAGGE
jgi:arylsulfatase A-like enzyme